MTNDQIERCLKSGMTIQIHFNISGNEVTSSCALDGGRVTETFADDSSFSGRSIGDFLEYCVTLRAANVRISLDAASAVNKSIEELFTDKD